MKPRDKILKLRRIMSNPFVSPALTKREREVARLAARGLKSKEIGELLGISESTANVHLKNIENKIGFNKSELTKRFVEMIEEVLWS